MIFYWNISRFSDDALSKNVKVEFIKYNDKTFLFEQLDDGVGMDIETMDKSLDVGETSGKGNAIKFNFGGKAGIVKS